MTKQLVLGVAALVLGLVVSGVARCGDKVPADAKAKAKQVKADDAPKAETQTDDLGRYWHGGFRGYGHSYRGHYGYRSYYRPYYGGYRYYYNYQPYYYYSYPSYCDYDY